MFHPPGRLSFLAFAITALAGTCDLCRRTSRCLRRRAAAGGECSPGGAGAGAARAAAVGGTGRSSSRRRRRSAITRGCRRCSTRRCCLVVAINPESRVKVLRGPAPRMLQQGGYTPVLVKIINESTITKRLRIVSPQSGPVYAGVAPLSLQRQQQTELGENPNKTGDKERFLAVEMFAAPPMTDKLSGLEVEYAIALIYCHEAGKREATIGFDVEQGNQDLGFRGEVPVLFDVKPAVHVKLQHCRRERPADDRQAAVSRRAGPHLSAAGQAACARSVLSAAHLSRPAARRCCCRRASSPWSPAAGRSIACCRGRSRFPPRPSTRSSSSWSGGSIRRRSASTAATTTFTPPAAPITRARPKASTPEDMFRQVKGEGLNVGCVLTWGPCFRYQRQFFQPKPHDLSEPLTRAEVRPGDQRLWLAGARARVPAESEGSDVSRLERPGNQGLADVDRAGAAVVQGARRRHRLCSFGQRPVDRRKGRRASGCCARLDASGDGELSPAEAADALLPEPFEQIDADKSGMLSLIGADRRARAGGRAVAEPGDSRNERRRGDGAAGERGRGRLRFHQRDGHAADSGMEHLVSRAELRLSAQGQRRDRFSLHEQPQCRPGAESMCGWGTIEQAGLHGLVRGDSRRPVVCVRRLCPRGGVSGRRRAAGRGRREAGRAGAREGRRPAWRLPPRRRWRWPMAASRRRPGGAMVGDTVDLHGPRYEEMLRGGKRLVEIVVNGAAGGVARSRGRRQDSRSCSSTCRFGRAVGSPCGIFRSCIRTR